MRNYLQKSRKIIFEICRQFDNHLPCDETSKSCESEKSSNENQEDIVDTVHNSRKPFQDEHEGF